MRELFILATCTNAEKKRVLWDFCSLIPKRNQTCLDCCMHVAFFQASSTWSNKQAGNSPQKSFQHPFKNAPTPCTPASTDQPNPIRRRRQIGKKISGAGQTEPLRCPRSPSACGVSGRGQCACGRTRAPQGDVSGVAAGAAARPHHAGADAVVVQHQLIPQDCPCTLQTVLNRAAVQAGVGLLSLSSELGSAADRRCQSCPE